MIAVHFLYIRYELEGIYQTRRCFSLIHCDDHPVCIGSWSLP